MADKKDEDPEENLESSEETESLEQQKQNMIKLFVKPLLGGQTYEIEISKKSTISGVKETLETQYQVSTAHQIMVHHDKQLPDDQTIEACGLQNKSTLYMLPKMRAGPLNYKVNTRAVQQYIKDIDQDVQDAMVKIGDDTGYPVKNDDLYYLTVNNKGEVRIVRVTNTEKPKPNDATDSKDSNEIKLETWDRLGENQQTRSKMSDLQRKMKASREERENKRKGEAKAKRRHEKTKTPVKFTKQAMLDTSSLEKQKSVESSISIDEDIKPVIKIKKNLPPSSNVIRGDYGLGKASASDDWNATGMWSISAEENPSGKEDIPRAVKGGKSYPVMEEYQKTDSDSFSESDDDELS